MLQLRYLLSQHVWLTLNTSVTICHQPSGRDQVGTFLTGKFSTMLMIVAHEPFVAAVHYSFIQGGEWIGILSQRGDLYQEDRLSHHITFSRRLFPICGAWAFLLVANWNAEKREKERWMPFLSGLTDPSHISCSAKAYREKREYLATLFDQTRKLTPFLSAASLIPVFKNTIQLYPTTRIQGMRLVQSS